MYKKINYILSYSNRTKIIFMIILMTFAGLFEALSIGLLAPFITFLVDPTVIFNNQYIQTYFPSAYQLDKIDLISIGLVVIFLSFLFKSIFLLWFNFKKNKYVFSVGNELSLKMYSNYIAQNYALHVQNKSSSAISTFVSQINIFVYDILLGGLELSSELIIIIFLILILFFINPSLCIFVILFSSILFLLFHNFSKKKLKSLGILRITSEKKLFEQIQQSHSGIKEILIYLKEHHFINEFKRIIDERVFALIQLQSIMDAPKIVLELIAVMVFILVIFFILQINSNINYYLPILGLYVAVAFKLLPALNRVIITVQKIKRSISSIDEVLKQLNNFDKNKEQIDSFGNFKKNLKVFDFKSKILLKNISFKYPETENYIFKNLNLEINKGSTIGIVGSSGEGKSTLVNIICGFNLPCSGKILVDGVDIKHNIRGWRMLLGYIPQDIYLFNESIIENVSFFSDKKSINKKKIKEVSQMAQLDSVILSKDYKEEATVGERGAFLSGGQSQRIALARALYKDPEILIFDEATSSLDDENEKKILESIENLKRKKTIIIISHRKSTLGFCDMIYKVENGKCILKKNSDI